MNGSPSPISSWLAQILQGSRARGLDPQAVRAVASVEGLSGGVGDGGHAFGPFQLNDAGGVLTGRPGNHRAFAESPQGISYALDQIAQVARGLHGGQAVNAIVRRFERPADPGGEVAKALAAYGGGVPAGGAAPAPSSSLGAAPAAPAADPQARRQAVMQIIGSIGHTGGVQPLVAALQQYRQAQPLPTPPGLPPRPAAPSGPIPNAHGGAIAELLSEGTGGPTHSTGPHLHFASRDPQAMLASIRQALAFGLAARENPYVDPVDPVHAPHSFHKIDFPGLYNGRKLGEATDFSGDPAKVAALKTWILTHYGR